MFDELIEFIRAQYQTSEPIPLHSPVFQGHERKYVGDTLDSTFVSSVGMFVNQFESEIERFTGCPRAIATVNGTAALQVSLRLAGVGKGDLVVTQALTFVATCNAIIHAGAEPIFIDVDKHTLGLSHRSLALWLEDNAYLNEDSLCCTKTDHKIIRACLPMHTFGHPVDLDGLLEVCTAWNLVIIEDAAESLGSFYKGQHTGTIGQFGALSFNGNKIITTGGGGMILTNAELGAKAKHLTTTAKIPHPYEFVHDDVGYNYRLPNINAALGCAQLEKLDVFLRSNRVLAERYEELFVDSDLKFVKEPENCSSNYWLNAVICKSRAHRNELLETSNEKSIMTRPIWTLMNHLPMYSTCRRGELDQSEWFADRVVNLPSSILPEFLS